MSNTEAPPSLVAAAIFRMSQDARYSSVAPAREGGRFALISVDANPRLATMRRSSLRSHSFVGDGGDLIRLSMGVKFEAEI